MVITLDHELPSEDELTVPELKLSGPALRAGAFHLGKYCQDTFNVRTMFRIQFPYNSIKLCTNFVGKLSYSQVKIIEMKFFIRI